MTTIKNKKEKRKKERKEKERKKINKEMKNNTGINSAVNIVYNFPLHPSLVIFGKRIQAHCFY